ncbi:MAG: ribosome biogenesis GTPase Der [Deltaproteobacteria bacterium]|nr:MAG: ribosome biogenesis GTPase Der [Deltaproteobacteria bacterium]
MNKKLVAIIGQPNVGKSTLFNRMAGYKKAIVQEVPGVTRDLNYADVTWHGRSFMVIDTGGLDLGSKEGLSVLVKQQCQLAIEEADLILFIMDGKAGLTPLDEEIAKILREQKKDVFFIVNKIDDPSHTDKIFDFYKLGVEKIYPLSASHGYGFHQLMEEIIQKFGVEETVLEEREEDKIKVAVVGRPNVGKSSIVNSILGYNRVLVSESPGTTRDAIDTPFRFKDEEYILIDTAGIRKKSRISLRLEKYSVVKAIKSIERADIVLHIIDATEGVTEQDTKIAGVIQEKGRGIVIVVNKWDLIKKDTKSVDIWKKSIQTRIKHLSFAPIIFVSAKTKKRIINILEYVNRVYKEYIKRIPTHELNLFLKEISKKKTPPMYKGKIVKLYYIAQVEICPPTFVIFTNYPKGIHFSYQRYIINRLREKYSFEGIPIRLFFKKR